MYLIEQQGRRVLDVVFAFMSGMYLIKQQGRRVLNVVIALMSGMYLIERLGRRVLTLISLLGIVLSLILLGIGFQLTRYPLQKLKLQYTAKSKPYSNIL